MDEVVEVDVVEADADVVDEEVGCLEVPDSKDLEFSFPLKNDSVDFLGNVYTSTYRLWNNFHISSNYDSYLKGGEMGTFFDYHIFHLGYNCGKPSLQGVGKDTMTFSYTSLCLQIDI